MKLNDPRINWGNDFAPPALPTISASSTPGIILEHQYNCLVKSLENAIDLLADIEWHPCDFPEQGKNSFNNAEREKRKMMYNLQEVLFYAVDILHSIGVQLGR